MKTIIYIIIFISMVTFGSCSIGQTPINKNGTGSTNEKTSLQGMKDTKKNETYFIEIHKDGFTPSNLSINMGDTVTFVNRDTVSHWPASANHPTHTVYPGSDIKKCGTTEQTKIFDSCRGILQNEIFIFTFDQIGTWGYHDHLYPTLFGKITVNE